MEIGQAGLPFFATLVGIYALSVRATVSTNSMLLTATLKRLDALEAQRLTDDQRVDSLEAQHSKDEIDKGLRDQERARDQQENAALVRRVNELVDARAQDAGQI